LGLTDRVIFAVYGSIRRYHASDHFPHRDVFHLFSGRSAPAQSGLDPVVMSVLSAVTLLLGFILVVETMPNVVAHSTGRVEQQDFLLPGILSTIASIFIITLVAYTYWQWIGFWP